jgi:NAD(P)-dependent dehydrogenase (short-subunit alcohol dehydrogenase family)
MSDQKRIAAVIGASGGLGRAFVGALRRDPRFGQVHAFSRSGDHQSVIMDPTLDDSIAEAVLQIGGPIRRLIITTGMLHDDMQTPEKSWRALDSAALARSFAINSIAPLMVIKAFLPLIPKNERAEIVVLSARVGSISDNRTGGWHGYRASKAALNQLIKTISIELSRSHPHLLCVAIHPGTVDTGMSAPFQRGVAADKLFTPAYSVERMLAVLDALTPEQSGRIFAWDGQEIPA